MIFSELYWGLLEILLKEPKIFARIINTLGPPAICTMTLKYQCIWGDLSRLFSVDSSKAAEIDKIPAKPWKDGAEILALPL